MSKSVKPEFEPSQVHEREPDTTGDLPSSDVLRLRGVRVHNLKNLNLDIPRNQFVVITGVSGSGKSSLAFDTIFAEGQRQFIETLSPYARQFLRQLERPDIDLIEGLEPTIAIDQRPGHLQPRSTVGTVTEIYDYLRILMARLGTPHCPECGEEIRQQSREQIIDRVTQFPSGTKAMILAPMVRGRRGQHADVIEAIRKAGFVRARIDGQVYDLDQLPEISPRKNHDIDAIVDRVIIRDQPQPRIAESINLALKHGDGALALNYLLPEEGTQWRDTVFSTKFACPRCTDVSIAEIEPRSFSFNSPYGACPTCTGLGTVEDPARVCPECHGARLRPEALAVRLGGKNIDELCRLSLKDCREFFAALVVDERDKQIANKVIPSIARRLELLERLGIGYLTLARSAQTLSGGEVQRVRLTTAIGVGLVGVCYVLDEPSIGLHPADSQRLIDALRELQGQGNTLVVVEHDEAMIREADIVFDLGPGAGKLGGEIVAAGTPEELADQPGSLTGDYLAGRASVDATKSSSLFSQAQAVDSQCTIKLAGASGHNLNELDVEFPLGALTCVTGVSGSGKSTLVMQTLIPAVGQALGSESASPAAFRELIGTERLQRAIEIDQTPIGRSPRSNAATYTGVFDEIRKVFATTKEAKLRGFKSSRFSFNNKSGRCESCSGGGQTKIEMKFLPDLYVRCATCGGHRFNQQTLEVLYRGKSIAAVLEMTVDEATEFFQNFTKIHRVLETLQSVGLGYLTLGQSSLSLSGGEAQRVKLAAELARRGEGHTLYVLDEPTTGLHFEDIRRLLTVLNRLVDVGNTVIVIEHHPDVIRTADWIIDLGPGGGKEGGKLIYAGQPAGIRNVPQSVTGKWLS
ncbi:MAG: excinuclease ABC subunit UvrA [Pirellulales bacterium]|nr:excinuclease ABC subunit UvrA [Pirellulales bacterium]